MKDKKKKKVSFTNRFYGAVVNFKRDLKRKLYGSNKSPQQNTPGD